MSSDTFENIKKWAKVINEKPNYDCTHFYLSDNEKSMIIDLKRMEKTPQVLQKLDEKEKAYLFIDLDNDKIIRYYAFNISPTTYAYTDEIDGKLMFVLAATSILKYIEDNISDLCTNTTPRSRLAEIDKPNYERLIPQSTFPVHSPSGTQYGKHLGGSPAQHEAWSNTSTLSLGYKEREQFLDTLYSLVKFARTAAAVDHIRSFVEKKKDSDKEMLNTIFRFISIDRLNLISIKELLLTTESIKDDLVERASVLTKFKTLVMNTKAKKATSILKEFQVDA